MVYQDAVRMENTKILKTSALEADFVNNTIIDGANLIYTQDGALKYNQSKLIPEVKDKFLSEVVGDLWHTENDQIQTFIYYNTGEYFCQRKKLKYDFTNNTTSWVSYSFTGATKSQAAQLYSKITELVAATKAALRLDVFKKVEEIDKEYLFYDQRYNKRVSERNALLVTSDWRVLPDVVDSYPGEKDMWMQWRNALRTMTIKKPTEFDDTLTFLKHIYSVRWPIDPKNYKDKYPNNEVEYLSTEDQWVERDVEASKNYIESKLMNIMELRQRYNESGIRVKASVKEMMQKLSIQDFIDADIDYNKIYTEEEINDLPPA